MWLQWLSCKYDLKRSQQYIQDILKYTHVKKKCFTVVTWNLSVIWWQPWHNIKTNMKICTRCSQVFAECLLTFPSGSCLHSSCSIFMKYSLRTLKHFFLTSVYSDTWAGTTERTQYHIWVLDRFSSYQYCLVLNYSG